MKLWQRYLSRQLLTTFCFLLICLFAVYILLDLSVNGVRFLGRGNAAPVQLLLYYLRSFSAHLELFIPLSFLLTTLKVLLDLNRHLELVALQTAGLSSKKLLFPFFALAALLSLVCYANSEWVAPYAMTATKTFRASYSKHKKKARRESLQFLSLADGSELVYQEYDASSNALFDVFWIRSPSDIWHIKQLAISSSPPIGHAADHLVRTQEPVAKLHDSEKSMILSPLARPSEARPCHADGGLPSRAGESARPQKDSKGRFCASKSFATGSQTLLEKTESFEIKIFSELPLTPDIAPQVFVPFERRPLSTLLRDASYPSADAAGIQSHLHYKLALPQLPFLIVLGLAPFAMQFSRKKPVFLLLALSLFGFIACTTLLDSLLILGENRVLPPWLALWFPLLFLFGLSIPRFAKL